MEHFSTRLKTYLQENKLSQYGFAKKIFQESKQSHKHTLRKVQRWLTGQEPRMRTYEGAFAVQILQDWEISQGLIPHELGLETTQAEEERNKILGVQREKMSPFTFFESQKIINTFCNSGCSFSSVLSSSDEKIIRCYMGMSPSHKVFTKIAIARKFRLSPSVVHSMLFSILLSLKYPDMLRGESFRSKTFQKGRIILDDFFKSGRILSKHLSKRQESFIRLRYGLNGRKPLTLQAIGDKYGLTREFIRRTNLLSLQKLS